MLPGSLQKLLPEQQQMGTTNHAIRAIAMNRWVVLMRFTVRVWSKTRMNGRRNCFFSLAAGVWIGLYCYF